MSKKFPEWLNDVLREKDWSQSELARRAGVSRATISDVILGQEKPGRKLCMGIASALNIPAEEVFRIAGLLPKKPEQNERSLELTHLFNMMTEANREDTLDYARMKLQKQEREDKKDGKPSRTAQRV